MSDNRDYNRNRQHARMKQPARMHGERLPGSHPFGRSHPKNLDEARLRPHLRQVQPPTPTFGNIDLMPNSALGQLTAQRTGKTFKPEPGDLRGIPAIGPGVGGVQPGTQPEQATISKLSRERAA